MSNAEVLKQAAEKMAAIESAVFFAKLAQYGITPENEEQRQFLLNQGNAMLEIYPIRSQEGASIKSASMEILGLPERKYASDGFSEEAHTYVEKFMQDTDTVQAAKLAFATQLI